jgi:large subunit ribosomal protein L5
MAENKTKQVKEKKDENLNPMRQIKIEKVTLSVGGTGDYLDKGHKLLKYLTGKNPMKTKSRKRIPTWNVRPGLEIGTVVTLRDGKEEFIKRVLAAIDNKLRKKQASPNSISFGVKEYIEIPGVEYQREIGIMGFDVTVTFKRAGRRVKLRKIKSGKVPEKQLVKREEIIKFMEDNFQVEFK